ncbi:hypothetical protein LTR91_014437 [Friedmanniomyces endolithicus]|uniref:Uncharacterized protein n=1 Tax=Friedmanniomyces endolithicus TaxID=329885 RepID=A0AAN6QNF4_9PEZI|nr:hypothetical protein LTR57_004263 [Friedmanniomyces endolithicus]KAK0969894.1 hypothetical protein LTS01_016020 [Friedmanniomyces endolithicus]KAK0974187.1 hypothetical protein LTR91_014437 [Friedmanniomyces endolithicus]KAK1041005.1 hypothetical protein LTS16_009932 [Friedmanniomyces endolithicus]
MAAATASSTQFSVDGKTAIVTGAGSGINYSFAKLLLSRGCNVVIADLGLRPEAQKLVDEYSSPTGGKARAVFVETNVVQWPELENMFVVADIVLLPPLHPSKTTPSLIASLPRSAPEQASSNRTGQTSGTHPAPPTPKTPPTLPRELATTSSSTSTSRTPSAAPSSP